MTMTTKPSSTTDSQEITSVATSVRWWQRVLWCIGGFDSATLAQPQCQAIRSKYSSMGALVLLTAVLASCSGGYAIYTIFHDWQVTCIMGTLWGFMILTLDRFLVSTTRKLAIMKNFNTKPDALPPYAHRNSWLLLAIRLPLAMMIGVVVAAPIEARLMKPMILEYENTRAESRRKAIEDDPILDKLSKEFSALESDIKKQYKDLVKAREEASAEGAGRGGALRGPGKIWKEKIKDRDNAQAMMDDLNLRLKQKGEEIRTTRALLMATAERDFTARSKNRSIISDIAIMREIVATQDSKGRSVWIVSTFLMLFFVLIECIPVLAKAISPYDPYDAVLQEIEHGSIITSLVAVRRQYAEASYSE